MKTRIISLRAAERLTREAGATRVSPSVLPPLVKEMEDHGMRIVKMALNSLKYSGKKTLQNKDLQHALENKCGGCNH